MFAVFVLLAIIVAIFAYAIVSGRRLAEFEEYMREQRFQFIGNQLPPTLQAPSNVWFPQIKILDCYVGSRNDFEAAIFRMQFPQGEGSVKQTMVAVRRPPIHDVRLNDFMTGLVTIDATSTPGWVIASMKGGSRRPPVLEPLLTALTARSSDEV